jgi:hypothetical protein
MPQPPAHRPQSIVVSLASRAYRTTPAGRAAVLALAALLPACGHAGANASTLIDLVTDLPKAERRALRPIDEAITVTAAGPAGDARIAIVMDAPARLTYQLRLPLRARLRTAVALVPDAAGVVGGGVTARIGISDGRVYEGLFLQKIDATTPDATQWHAIDLDLSAYAGWQWSLFYRPSEREWRLIINTDATPAGRLAWARPEIIGQGHRN